jgi:tetratricopeptide (TPR) repeat protein
MLKGRSRSGMAFVCAAASLFSSLVRAEPPLSRSLNAEPSHTTDEREFPPATVRAYQRAMALGVEEFAAGRWAEARALFLRGHALMPNARSFRALGMTAFNLKHYAGALRELSEALSDPRRPLDRALRSQTEELCERAQTFVGSYHLRVEPGDAELRVDGVVTKLPLDGGLLLGVGEHLIELDAPGHVRLTRSLLVDGRDDEHLYLRLQGGAQPAALPTRSEELQLDLRAGLPRGDSSDGSRTMRERVFADYRFSWGVGAGTLALAVAAAGVHLRALDEARDVKARCQGQCVPWDGATDRRDKLNGLSDGLLISTLVFSVATIVLVLVEHQRALERDASDRKYASAKSGP